jgi:GNAT superfamily N-acetyltransferase
MAVTVRRATKADAAKVAEFATALAKLHAEWDAKRFTQIIGEGAAWYYGERAEAENAAVFVAEIDGKTIGFAYMEYEAILYAELATNVAWLHDIYIEPDSRDLGAGKALIAAVKDEGKRLGANKVLLSVAVANEHGQHLFERSGFRTTMFEMMLEI